MKKLLITGGAGFLGYHLCKKLSREYDEIVIIDIDEFNKKDFDKNVRYFKLDVRDRKGIDKLIEKENPNHIIHAAAALPLYKPAVIRAVNIGGTRNIFESAFKNNVGRVVFISSTAVYGIPDKHPLYEYDEMVGVGAYGETKIIGERICKEYRKKGVCVPVIRPKTFIGTGRLGVFQILYDWVEYGKRIPIIGNGKNRYQLLEVQDLVDAIKLMLDKERELVDDVFNVGARDFEIVLKDVGKLCSHAKSGARVLKTPSKIVKFLLRVLEILKLSPLYKWVYGTAEKDSFVSTEKIEKIGWNPKFSNSQALINSYDWYLENKVEANEKGIGVTHRVAWSQGALGLVKKIM